MINVTILGRRAVTGVGRRIPVLRQVFRELDSLRATNAELITERERAEAARYEAAAEREKAEVALIQAVRERDQAVVAREQAELARWQAARERDEADAARRRALMGYEWHPRKNNGVGSQRTGSLSPVHREGTQPSTELDSGNKTLAEDMKISIVLPNYNHDAFIEGNVAGVRAQTYSNWELIIVDDGSTDNSRATIESLARADKRIIPIFLAENRGTLFAIETALAAATGELLYGSAADDYIANERFFERVISALIEHPQVSGVFGKASVCDATSNKELWRMGSSPVHGLILPAVALEGFFSGRLFVPGAAAIWKRAEIDALGGFDSSLGPQTDYFLNHALPIVAGAVFIDEVFTVVRSSANTYHRSATEDEYFRRHALVENKIRSLNLPSPLEPGWLQSWRDRVVDGRFCVTRQQEIFDAWREAISRIEPWDHAGLPKKLIECTSRVLGDIEQLESELASRIASAHSTLDAIAGPVQ